MKLKTIVMALCAGTAACLSAQGTARLVPPAPAETTVAAGDVVKVQGKGSGATRDEALKDAYRDAIERAVGLYVDAEQMVKNDELVNDQILTQSNAYIEKYDVLKESSANGLVTLKILATVKKTALTKKLSDVMPPQTFKLGDDAQNVHAVAVTKEKRSEDAVALLKKTLDGVNPITQMIRLTLADPKLMTQEIRGQGNGTKTCYFYRFKFELDEKKYYEEFLPPLLKVLDQISVSRPKTVRLQRHSFDKPNSGAGSQYRSGQEYAKNYIAAGEYVNDTHKNSRGRRRAGSSTTDMSLDGLDRFMNHHGQEGVYDGVIVLGNADEFWHLSYSSPDPNGVQGNDHCFDPGSHNYEACPNHGIEKQMVEAETFPVMIITEMNASRTSVTTRCYQLPKGCADVIMTWQYGLIGMTRPNRTPRTTTYQFILKDGNNEDVLVRSISFKNVALLNMMAGHAKMFKESGGYGWYVTPMIHTDAKSLQRWIGFDIPRDDLPKIKAVSVELAD